MKKTIATKKAPSAIGPYAQGMQIGNFIYTSGQLPMNPETGQLIQDDIQKATRQSLTNVAAILEEAGATMDQVVKTTIFLKDLHDFAAVNEVYGQFFTENCPARSCVQVAKLPLDALIEIEAIAYVSY